MESEQQAGGAGKKSLVKKLAEVMALVTHVPKTGTNDFHNYKYATEAAIVAAVRMGMAERGLMLVPSVVKTDWTSVPRRNGGADRLCTLTVRFTVLDGESGERESFEVMGEGQDAGDKATYKAMTGAVKYALLKLFLIPTGDDPEHEDKDATPSGKSKKAGERKETSRPTHPVDTGPSARAASPPTTPAPFDEAKVHSTVVAFGLYKGKTASALSDAELSETIDLAHQKLMEEPNARWAKAMRENLGMLEMEAEFRVKALKSAPAEASAP